MRGSGRGRLRTAPPVQPEAIATTWHMRQKVARRSAKPSGMRAGDQTLETSSRRNRTVAGCSATTARQLDDEVGWVSSQSRASLAGQATAPEKAPCWALRSPTAPAVTVHGTRPPVQDQPANTAAAMCSHVARPAAPEGHRERVQAQLTQPSAGSHARRAGTCGDIDQMAG
jgi:hypothetical protein